MDATVFSIIDDIAALLAAEPDGPDLSPSDVGRIVALFLERAATASRQVTDE
jgi:hypothetical protein